MTKREIVLKILKGEKTDKMVFMPLCSRTYFRGLKEYATRFKAAWNDRCVPIVSDEQELEEYAWRINYFTNLGIAFKSWATEEAYILEYDTANGVNKTITRDEKGVHVLYTTPAGNLKLESQYAENNSTLFARGHLLNTPEDMKIFKRFLEAPVIVKPEYEKASKLLEILGDDGIFTARMPCAPVKDWILNEMGVDGVIFGLLERPDEIAELEELLHKVNLDICNVIAGSPYTVFNDASVFGTGMVSPEIIRDHYLPTTKEYIEIMHGHGKITWNHASGEPLGDVLDLFLETGVKVLSGITYPGPDYDLAEVCRKFEGKVALVGGLSPHFLATAGLEEIKDTTKMILDITAPFSNFILGTADDVVYGTPVRNLEAVAKITNDFKK